MKNVMKYIIRKRATKMIQNQKDKNLMKDIRKKNQNNLKG